MSHNCFVFGKKKCNSRTLQAKKISRITWQHTFRSQHILLYFCYEHHISGPVLFLFSQLGRLTHSWRRKVSLSNRNLLWKTHLECAKVSSWQAQLALESSRKLHFYNTFKAAEYSSFDLVAIPKIALFNWRGMPRIWFFPNARMIVSCIRTLNNSNMKSIPARI